MSSSCVTSDSKSWVKLLGPPLAITPNTVRQALRLKIEFCHGFYHPKSQVGLWKTSLAHPSWCDQLGTRFLTAQYHSLNSLFLKRKKTWKTLHFYSMKLTNSMEVSTQGFTKLRDWVHKMVWNLRTLYPRGAIMKMTVLRYPLVRPRETQRRNIQPAAAYLAAK